MKQWRFPFRTRSAGEQALLSLLDGDGGAPALRSAAGAGVARPLPGLTGSRRLARPRPLAGLALLLIAVVGYWSLAGRVATARTPVLVAARALPAGATLNSADVRVAHISGDPAMVAALIPAGRLPSLIGRRLQSPLAGGAPVLPSALAPAGRVPAAFTLTLPALNALAGALRPGDRVSVLVTYTSAAGQASTHVVARHVLVLAVGAPRSGLDPGTATVPVTVDLSQPGLATALALANEAGKIDLLRDGSNSDSPIPPANQTVQAGGG
jgi:Flp pilus assembly protein CpaB